MKPVKFSPFIKDQEKANGLAMEELGKHMEEFPEANPDMPFMISFEADGQLYILVAHEDHLFLDTAHMISMGKMDEGPFAGKEIVMPMGDTEASEFEEWWNEEDE